MECNEAQYRTWLELVGDILQQPAGVSMRHEEQLLDLLMRSFNGVCATRNQVRHKWANQILECWPRNYIPNEPPGDYDHRHQPLLRWHSFTGQRGPQSLWRVPDTLASNSLKRTWDELAGPWNINHQLSIPLQGGGADLNSFLVQRSDRDFTDQELDLASLLQPILTGVARHLELASNGDRTFVPASACRLTVREMAIMSLLSNGLTAQSLARRLSISPRTAEKHLENIYRKLDVGDRLMAVRRAYELGLLTPPAASIQIVHSDHPPGRFR
ncbi:LuxR C-terminal-related transcriptional regulator [Arthrobacter sp. NPDC057013]|uniref:helix-turn-helix transcriptional regulator n=1 Tax=Arthrobacter sp. NPDC057013 TaxID=3345999 RepID=UPI0036358F7F